MGRKGSPPGIQSRTSALSRSLVLRGNHQMDTSVQNGIGQLRQSSGLLREQGVGGEVRRIRIEPRLHENLKIYYLIQI
jgi:hypothetical protein